MERSIISNYRFSFGRRLFTGIYAVILYLILVGVSDYVDLQTTVSFRGTNVKASKQGFIISVATCIHV